MSVKAVHVSVCVVDIELWCLVDCWSLFRGVLWSVVLLAAEW